jgi:hypothetical protein
MKLAYLALFLGSCGLIDQAVDRIVSHCDLREGIEPRPYCQEWRGLIASPGSDVTPTGICAAIGSDYTKTECPDLDQVVGGCFIGKLGDGSGSYHWYYSSAEDPRTADDVRSECGESEFVEWFPFAPDAGDFGPP